ncbi:17990_t:CDS:2, partial [Racocetra persica]
MVYWLWPKNSSKNTEQPVNNPSPNPNNIQYLPSETEAQTKINQIKSSKNLDDQQATIEFLTSYIKLVNSKTGFPPFPKVPSVDEFNQRADQVFGLDFNNYVLTVLKPLMDQVKFKPAFATQTNYQELARRLQEEINPLLSSLTTQFSSLNSVGELNNLTETLLSKYFQGYIYAEAIHDELGQQLGITNHQKFEGQKT